MIKNQTKLFALILFISVIGLASFIEAQPIFSLQPGVTVSSLSANAGGAGTNGTAFATIPQASILTWQVSFSSAPGSDTILLQGSFDNSTYLTLDTSTAVAGEIRTIQTAVPFVRCNINAKSGGGTTTCQLISKSMVTSSGTFDRPTILFGNGSAGAPSISFSSNPTSGFFNNAGVPNLSVLGANTYVFGASTFQTNTSILTNGNVTIPIPSLFNWSAGTQLASASTDGHLQVSNAATTIGARIKVDALPSVSACGAGSPAVIAGSTPFSGAVTIGTTAVATCTITFNGTAFPSAPHCSGSVETTTAANTRAMGYSASATVLTIVPTAAWADSSVVNWHCISSR